MKQITWKRIAIALILLLLIASAGFVFWAESALGPSAPALEALAAYEQVTVSTEDRFIAFEPEQPAPIGFILYPGARVDPRSYTPILRRIAQQGYLATVVDVSLNLAILDTEAAQPVLAHYPDIEGWVVGGHSMGGVAAATYATRQPLVEGLVLLASYPADDALKESGLPTLSIYGSLDGLATPQDIDDSRASLPAETTFLEIEGGNHAQFGAYGPQSGDNEATISAEAQWSQIVGAVVDLLDMISQ